MVKTISSNLNTHLDLTVTSLATIWRILRTDGVSFYFTDHDSDLAVDDGSGSQTYIADSGYTRTSVANNVGLSVDNLDVEGVFDSDQITEDELRAGKFDFAEVFVSIVNWQVPGDGVIKMRRGHLGEVAITPQGVFKAELRGMTQELSQNLVEQYQPECRVDLGSTECGVPIRPDVLPRNTAVALGTFYRVATITAAGINWTDVLRNKSFDTDAAATPVAAVTGWTIVSGTWSLKTSDGALVPEDGVNFLAGNDTAGEIKQVIDLTALNVSTTEIDAGNVTIDFAIKRANSAADDTAQVVVQGLDSTGAPVSTLYDSTDEEITPVDTWVARTATGVALAATTRSIAVRLITTLVTGGIVNCAFDEIVLDIDDTNSVTTFQEVYENRVYEVTTAGTTAVSQPVYDTTISNTTTDGTAVLTARDSFTRHGHIVDFTANDTLTLDYTDTRAVDDWFNGGGIIFEEGKNEDVVREIKDWTQTGAILESFLPAIFDLVPGTKVRAYPGCDKRLTICSSRFDNTINFRGEPYVPGQDAISNYPDSR